MELLALVGEGDVALDGDGSFLELDERRAELSGQPLWVADRRRKIEPLRAAVLASRLATLLAVVFQPRDEAVEAVAAFRLFERVNLVDDDRPDVAEILARPQGVIDPLVGADDHVRAGIEPRAVVVDPARADPDRHVEAEVAVPIPEILVFLVGQRDQRHEKQHLALAVQRAIHAREFADQRFACRGRADDELVVAIEEAVPHRNALDRQQLVEPRFDHRL